jgi:molecular chaperone GrpE
MRDEPGDTTELNEPQHEQPSQPRQDKGFKVHDRRFWAMDQEELEAEEEQRSELPSYVEQLKAQLEEKDRQLQEYIQAYKKEVGEGLDRTKQRLERDAGKQLEQMRGQLSEPMLEVLDALERSLEAAAAAGGNPEALLQGVQMVYQLMVNKLQELGLTRIPARGEPFDPRVHEALAVQPVDDPSLEGVVIHEVKPGFLLGERVVRPAQVLVGKVQS